LTKKQKYNNIIIQLLVEGDIMAKIDHLAAPALPNFREQSQDSNGTTVSFNLHSLIEKIKSVYTQFVNWLFNNDEEDLFEDSDEWGDNINVIVWNGYDCEKNSGVKFDPYNYISFKDYSRLLSKIEDEDKDRTTKLSRSYYQKIVGTK
jgi:hypothetical protein